MNEWERLAIEIVQFLRGGLRRYSSGDPRERTVVDESVLEAWERRIKILRSDDAKT